MTKPLFSKIVALFTSLAVLVAVLGVTLAEPIFQLPIPFAYAIRVIVMSQAGIFLGLVSSCGYFMIRLKVDPSDELLRPLGAVTACAGILALYTIFSMTSLLTVGYITWRAPTLFAAFLIGDWGLCVLAYRLRRISLKALNRSAVVKMTFLDTHEPGPDIDLSHGGSVVKS